jgi:small-conductance mechanosensitive channel
MVCPPEKPRSCPPTSGTEKYGRRKSSLMETGNWVSKDMYNGRIARITTSAVLKGAVFNYSQGFQFIWDEIKVVFTTTSDCQFAKEMLTRVAKEVIGTIWRRRKLPGKP